MSSTFRANYFLAIRINNENLLRNIEVFQDHQIVVDENLKKFCESSVKAHVTLNVLQLDSTDDITKCIKLLNENLIVEEKSECKLKFKGVGKFGKKIIYAKPIKDEGEEILQSLFSNIKRILDEGGIKVENKKQYNPHITMFKVPRRKNYDIECNTDHFENFVFGEETVSEILLLPMNEKRDEKGFYLKKASFPLHQKKRE